MVNSDLRMKKLAALNAVLFLLHLFSAAYIYWNKEQVGVFLREIRLTRNEVEPGVDRQRSGTVYTIEDAGTANVVDMIAVFFAITSAFHFMYAIGYRGWYKNFIDQGWNPVRWIEYSVTASIMAMILALSATIADVMQLVLIATMVASIMLLGSVIEFCVRKGDAVAARLCTAIAWILQIVVFFVIARAFISTIGRVNALLEKREGEVIQIPDFVYIILVA